jgi:hypothetical protein
MKKLVVVAAAALLAGCGAKPEQRAVDACQKAVTQKLAGKSFELDADDMLAKVQKQSDTVMQINSTVFFDKGLPAETKQTFDCRVQFDANDAAKEPVVTFMQFNW